MNILLDTHALLWFYGGDAQLSLTSQNLIKDISNNCHVSIASIWEITIKYNIRKLELENSLADLFEFIKRNQISVIPIEFEHLLKLSSLPLIHRDPFDRIIIAQGITEKLTVISKDSFFTDYDLPIIW
ncbi:MAG: type II toxin-antitoxin system VapC family toxin [Emticicia sp.]|uniref:type II toxin-antitoxin system VapC family toxin n=1 Tax=Emticicia sp. TaxID=1930953 RepID=UPI003BA4C13C